MIYPQGGNEFIPLVCFVQRSQQTASGSAGSLWPAARSRGPAPSPPPEELETFSQQRAKSGRRHRRLEGEILKRVRPRCRRSTGRAAPAFWSRDTSRFLRDTRQRRQVRSNTARFIENSNLDREHCIHHNRTFLSWELNVTTQIPEKLGRHVKHKFNRILFDINSTKKLNYLLFYLIVFIDFWKYMLILNLVNTARLQMMAFCCCFAQRHNFLNLSASNEPINQKTYALKKV